LNYFFELGEALMNHHGQQYVEHHLTARPYPSLRFENGPFLKHSPPDDSVPLLHECDCRARFSGLLWSHARKAR
jgi:hypothetical protein